MRPSATARADALTAEEVPAAVGEPEAPPAGAPAEAILALQRSAGNQSVARLLDPVGAQSRWPWGYGPWPERDPYLTPPDPPEQIEYETLAPIRHYFEKQSYEGYLEIRELLLAKFGLEQDGPQAAVQRALAYYPEGDAAAAAPARQALAAFVFRPRRRTSRGCGTRSWSRARSTCSQPWGASSRTRSTPRIPTSGSGRSPPFRPTPNSLCTGS